MSFLRKTNFWATLWEILDFFLFQHLVTPKQSHLAVRLESRRAIANKEDKMILDSKSVFCSCGGGSKLARHLCMTLSLIASNISLTKFNLLIQKIYEKTSWPITLKKNQIFLIWLNAWIVLRLIFYCFRPPVDGASHQQQQPRAVQL